MTIHFPNANARRTATELPRREAPIRAAVAHPVHDARELTAGGVEARIVLDGTPYVLRITRLGKLILTK